MNKGIVEIIIRAKDLASNVVKGFEKNLRSSVRLVKDVGRDLAAIGAATVGAIIGLQRMGKAGAEVIGVKTAFARITANEVDALQKLRAASRGTISDLDLMTGANMALSLGAAKSADEVANLVRQSRALGRALKIDAATAFEKYTVALSRQSKLRLDDLGIIIDVEAVNKRYAATLGTVADNLNDAQKAEAFRTEAMRKADELILKLGDSTNRGAEAAERFGAQVQNVKNRLMEFVATSPRVAAFLDALALQFQELAGEDVGLAAIEASLGNVSNLDVLRDRYKGVADEIAAITESLKSEHRVSWIAKAEEDLAQLSAELAIIERRMRAVAPSLPEGPQLPSAGGGLAGPPALGGSVREMQGLLTAIRGAEEELQKADLAGKLAAPGEEAAKAAEKVRTLANELARLKSLADQFGGAEGLFLATSPMGPAPSHLLRPQTIEDPNAQYKRKRYSLAPAFSLPGAERGLPFGDTLHPTVAGPLDKAEDRFKQTAGVVAATMGDMAADVIRGTGSVSSSVMSMIGNILQSATKDPLTRAVIGGVFAIGSALFSKKDRPKVVVDDYSSTALSKMNEANKRPIRITNIIESGGRPIAEIEREMYDRQDRDEVVRFPPGSSLRG